MVNEEKGEQTPAPKAEVEKVLEDKTPVKAAEPSHAHPKEESGSTFTPEQQKIVDGIVKDRLKREKDKFDSERQKYQDYDDLKKKLEELETKGLSEQEKLRKEHEKLQGLHKNAAEELEAYKLKSTITDALLDAGANPKQLSKLALRVIGETPEEITADIAELKKDFPAMFGNYSTAALGGHPTVQDGQTAPKVWRASEIRALSHEQRIANEKDIMRAMREPGGIIMD